MGLFDVAELILVASELEPADEVDIVLPPNVKPSPNLFGPGGSCKRMAGPLLPEGIVLTGTSSKGTGYSIS